MKWQKYIPTFVSFFRIHTLAFSPSTSTFTSKVGVAVSAKSKLSMSSSQTPTITQEQQTLFPVISRIAGNDWTGKCRYVNGNLNHLSNLKLTGGLRYDINGTTVTLSSFLTFPNGNTREVMMQGTKDMDGKNNSTMRLSSIEKGGPIYMMISEIERDTIIINEIEESTGKIILTASISLLDGKEGMELIQISHEVGDNSNESKVIEGHQVWRLYRNNPMEYDDFGSFQDTTAR